MAFSILTNTERIHTHAGLLKASSAQLSRLSSGLKVSTQDDAAGFAIARKLKADTAAQMPTRQGAVDLSQSLDGGLSHTRDILARMQELARQSQDDSSSAADRDLLNAEFTKLKEGAVQVANSSQNGESWFVMGAGAPKSMTVGDASLDQSRVALIGSSDPEDGILTRSYDGVSFSSDAFDISGASSKEQRQGVLNALKSMLSGVHTAQYAVGAFANGVTLPVSNGPADTDDGTYTRSLRDVTDMEEEKFELRSIRTGSSILAGANQLPQLAFSLLNR